MTRFDIHLVADSHEKVSVVLAAVDHSEGVHLISVAQQTNGAAPKREPAFRRKRDGTDATQLLLDCLKGGQRMTREQLWKIFEAKGYREGSLTARLSEQGMKGRIAIFGPKHKREYQLAPEKK